MRSFYKCKLCILICNLFAIINLVSANQDCIVELQNHCQPLFVEQGDTKIIEPIPPEFKNIRVKFGHTIEMHCVGRDNHFNLKDKNDKDYVTKMNEFSVLKATCKGDKRFLLKSMDEMYQREYESFQCLFTPQITLSYRKIKSFENSQKRTTFDMSYELDADREIVIIKLFHDPKLDQTTWTHYQVKPSDSVNLSGRPVKDFKINLIVNKEVEGKYKTETIKKTFRKLISEENLEKILNGGQFILDKGHLAASQEFATYSVKEATFYYINVAPQWSKINRNNWKYIEEGVAKLMGEYSWTADIYTGTIGILEIFGTKMYLDADSNPYRMPIPKFFYKIIIVKENAALLRGIVFVSVNDRFFLLDEQTNRVRDEYFICDVKTENIVKNKYFRNWEPEQIDRGFSYACDVFSFVQWLLVNHPIDVPPGLLDKDGHVIKVEELILPMDGTAKVDKNKKKKGDGNPEPPKRQSLRRRA